MANGSYGKCPGCGEMVIWKFRTTWKELPEKRISLSHMFTVERLK